MAHNLGARALAGYVTGLGEPYHSHAEAILRRDLSLQDILEKPELWKELSISNPLHRAVLEFNLNQLASNGLPGWALPAATAADSGSADSAAALPFPRDGISLAHIDQFIAACGGEDAMKGLTTTDVNMQALMPMTHYHKSSYCDMARDTYGAAAGIGKPIAFISHAWKYQFLDVIGALRYHFRSETDLSTVYIWFDLFTNNQHGAPTLDFTWWSTTFKNAIQDIGRTVVVLTPWKDPIPFTRAWCLYEIFCTVDTESCFEVAMSPAEQQSFVEAAKDNVDELKAMVSNIDVQKSEAFNPADLTRIFDVITSTCGFDLINCIVLNQIRQWVIKSVQATADSASDEIDKHSLLYTLGLLYDQMGMFDKALALQEVAVKKFQEWDGENSHATIQKVNNLAILYDRQGKSDKAEALFAECLKNYETIIGDNHVDYYNTMNSLATVYIRRGKCLEAQPLLERCRAFFTASLGREHPNTVKCIASMGIIHDSLGDFALALQMFEEAVEIFKKTLGERHQDTLVALNSLALVHLNLKNYQTSVNIFEEVLAAKRVKFGFTHPSTLKSMSNLAHLYSQLGVCDRAMGLFREAWDGYQMALGLTNYESMYCLYNMCHHYMRNGLFEEALPFCEILSNNVEEVWPGDESRCNEYKQPYVSCAQKLKEDKEKLEKLPDLFTHSKHEHDLAKVYNPYHTDSEKGLQCRCDLCDKNFSGWVFHCAKCGFDIDIDCALQEVFSQQQSISEPLKVQPSDEGPVDA